MAMALPRLMLLWQGNYTILPRENGSSQGASAANRYIGIRASATRPYIGIRASAARPYIIYSNLKPQRWLRRSHSLEHDLGHLVAAD